MFNQIIGIEQGHCRIQIHVNFAIFVKDPLAEVPRYLQHFGGILPTLELSGVSAQVLKYVVGARAVDVTLVHQLECHVVFLAH